MRGGGGLGSELRGDEEMRVHGGGDKLFSSFFLSPLSPIPFFPPLLFSLCPLFFFFPSSSLRHFNAKCGRRGQGIWWGLVMGEYELAGDRVRDGMCFYQAQPISQTSKMSSLCLRL